MDFGARDFDDCEAALLASLRGPDFERALSGPGGIIEYLRDRGLIRIERPRKPEAEAENH
jgi:hypothetical protein